MATFIIHGSIAAIVSTLCGQSLPRVMAYALLFGLASKLIERVQFVWFCIGSMRMSDVDLTADIEARFPAVPSEARAMLVNMRRTIRAELSPLALAFIFAPAVAMLASVCGLAYWLFA